MDLKELNYDELLAVMQATILGFKEMRAQFDADVEERKRMSEETAQMFKETDRQFKEVANRFKETDMQIKETANRFKETDRQFKETANRFKETDMQIKETANWFKETDRQFKETDKKFQETDRQFKETDKKFNKLQGLFVTQWGKLVEAIMAPGCLKLFRQRGIDISQAYRNSVSEINGIKKAEYDVVLANGNEVVIVEIKTTCKVEHVNYLLQKLTEVKTFIKSYSDKKIYGAIAAISFDESSDSYAVKKGLFVIKTSDEGIVQIDNEANFKPMEF